MQSRRIYPGADLSRSKRDKFIDCFCTRRPIRKLSPNEKNQGQSSVDLATHTTFLVFRLQPTHTTQVFFTGIKRYSDFSRCVIQGDDFYRNPSPSIDSQNSTLIRLRPIVGLQSLQKLNFAIAVPACGLTIEK